MPAHNSGKTIALARWTRVTFYGWMLGLILILVLSSLLDSAGIEHIQFYLGVGMGAGVGFTQWLVFKKHITIGKNWVLYSIIGMGIPFIILDILPDDTIAYKLPLSITLGSLCVGALQFTMLKRYSPKAYLWIPGCVIGWVLAVGTVFIVDYTKQLAPIISSNLMVALLNLFLILAGGVVLGVITGLTLRRVIA